MRHLTLAIMATASLLISTSASALTAKQIVEKETVVQMPDGTESVTRSQAEMVVPGERIVYTLNFTNDDQAPATDLVLTMPVPPEIKFMEGSAILSGATTVYSADGGHTFSSRDSLRKTGVDGAVRSANAEDITHIRWTVTGPVAVGETGTLSFKGVLK